jgi:hypothetical protein
MVNEIQPPEKRQAGAVEVAPASCYLLGDLWASAENSEPGVRGDVLMEITRLHTKACLAEGYLLVGLLSSVPDRLDWLHRARGAAFACRYPEVHLASILLECGDALVREDQGTFQRLSTLALLDLSQFQIEESLTGQRRQEHLLVGLTYSFYALTAHFLDDPVVPEADCWRAAELSALVLERESGFMGLRFGPQTMLNLKGLIPAK